MNLGDGLMFELVSGKPKLVLVNCGVSEANTKSALGQVLHRNRTPKPPVNLKQCSKEPERPQRDRKCRDTTGLNYGQQDSERGNRRKTKVKGNSADSGAFGVVRVQSQRKLKNTDESSKVIEVGVKTVKENLVCLTQEQFQQILNNIKVSGKKEQNDVKIHIENEGPSLGVEEEGASSENVTIESAELLFDRNNQRHTSSQEKKDEKNVLDPSPSGFFAKFGEREWERDALEAKKAQWKKELDEQVAIKKQHKVIAEVKPQGNSVAPRRGDQLPEVQEDGTAKPSRSTENSRPSAPQTHSNTKTLPSAMRSTFALGEATAAEHGLDEEKKDQQRLWLQELEQQREEAKLRKKVEKEIQQQAEDHDRWAMHFDSFQRRLLPQPLPALASDRDQDRGSSLSHHPWPSGGLSTVSEATSAFGVDSLGRASVDITQGNPPKASFLRSMTALLDPAQLEERERRRIKQLEHQRAIEAQLEEQRSKKEREEAARKASEQEEEKRLAKEREVLQQEYLKDTHHQKEKEEQQSRKVRELALSIQRAQEEAQKEKQLQRIRDLAKKGHDVSNLLRVLEGSSPSQGQGTASSPTSSSKAQITETSNTRKDIAVQTEGNPSPETRVGNGDVQVERRVSPHIKQSGRERNVERKATSRLPPHNPPLSSVNPQPPHRQLKLPPQKGEGLLKGQSTKNSQSRGRSPPVPAVQRRLQQIHQPSDDQPEEPAPSTDRPPSSDYVPYIRTDEIYHLDPLPPISRPSTREAPQKTHTDGNSSKKPSALIQRDTQRFHPEVIKSLGRQQAVLKGLSELRQGLMLKQRELETSLSPLLQGQSRSHSPTYQQM